MVKTGCKEEVEFQGLGVGKVVGQFDGGRITTDAGALLLGEVEHARGFLRDFSKCFTDYRNKEAIEHTVEELVSQRIYGIALGYEDLDATDDPIQGNQEGRFFHGYYGEYCYLPLYIFCGDHVLCAKVRGHQG